MTMIMQMERSKKIFEAVANEELSVTMSRTQLKTLCLPGDAIKLILDTAIIMHAIKTNTLKMHNLSEFHHLIDKQNLNELGFLGFAMHQRQNLACKKFNSSPMHALDLGEVVFYCLQL